MSLLWPKKIVENLVARLKTGPVLYSDLNWSKGCYGIWPEIGKNLFNPESKACEPPTAKGRLPPKGLADGEKGCNKDLDDIGR